MMAAMATPDVALVSGDLLFASRLRAVLAPATELLLATGSEVPEAGTVFVDLNQEVDARIDLISKLRARGSARIIGFCQHDERGVRVRAMEQGADQVVTNGALQQAAIRLVATSADG
jgi:DNA-binding NarL/FixJ family response regulator